MLLGDDSDSEIKITVNKSYAERYNTWRQKEEIQKLKDRYGDGALKDTYGSSDDSSPSEDEDENAEQLTQQLEKDFFKTLSYLKKKDPCIYDKNTRFFDKSVSTQKQSKNVKKEEKPLFLRDYERKLIVEKEGRLSEDEDKNAESGHTTSPTIAEEEKIIKDNLKNALKDSEDENGGDDDAWGGIFKKRVKTKEDEEKEDENYREWLKGQKEKLADKSTKSDLKYLHDFWNDPSLKEDEKFLKDYILNKRYLEEKDDAEYIPTYEEIVHDSDENLSEDEKTIEKQEEFEHKFNFRFEEPDKEFIKCYPRTMENSLRKKDDRRKRKRQEVRQRKAAEEAKKREELKRLKSLKRKEIMEKIEKLKEITGNDEVGFKDEDLEGDFDPEKYDKRMRQLFNQEFYEEEETTKPECPELDEELEIENWKSWNEENYEHNNQDEFGQEKEYEPHCEDPDFNMDCDYNPNKELQNELTQSSKRMKKGKKWKSMFAQAISRKKPIFDSSNHTFDQYLDEYYKLDFEDLIGDLPCRFKYRKVMPNSFGLSIDEILKSDDKELNKWCSLKKVVQHRPEHVEKYDVHAYQRKADNEQLKKKILQSVYAEKLVEEQDETENKKQKKEKKAKKHKYSPKKEKTELEISDSSEKKEVNTGHEHLAEVYNEHTNKQCKRKHKKQKEVVDIDKVNCSFSKKRKLIENGDPGESNTESDGKFNKQKKKHKKQKTGFVERISEHLINSDSITEKGNAVDSNMELVIRQGSQKESNHENMQNSLHNQVSSKEKKKKNKKANNILTTNIDIQIFPPKFNKNKIAKKFSDKQRKKIPKKRFQGDQNGLPISDARLRAYGINPKKYKKKIKYANR